MTDTSTNRPTGRRSSHAAVATDRDGTSAGVSSGVVPAIAMTPAAALARHIEWLDFALGAATAEERWRRERLAKAGKGNRAKRTDRLADVIAEIDELTALLAGIRELQAKASAAAPAPRRGRPPGSKNGTGRRSTTAAPAATPAAEATRTSTAATGTARRTTAPRAKRTTATRQAAKVAPAKATTVRATTAKASSTTPASTAATSAARSTATKPAAARRRSTAASTPSTSSTAG